jgi:hypothetical protein
MADAPWWATGAFTILGAVAAHIANTLNNRSRARFEDARRWHQERKELYLKAQAEIVYIRGALEGPVNTRDDLPDDLDSRLAALWQILQETQLVGSQEVASEMLKVYLHLHVGVQKARTGEMDPEWFGRFYESSMMDTMQAQARADLTNDRRALHEHKPALLLGRRWWRRRRARKELRMVVQRLEQISKGLRS